MRGRSTVGEAGVEPAQPKRPDYSRVFSPHDQLARGVPGAATPRFLGLPGTRRLGCLTGTAPANTRVTAGPLAFWVQAPVGPAGVEPAASVACKRRSIQMSY